MSMEKAQELFGEAGLAASELSACHPIRLKIVQYLSLFTHKTLNDKPQAISQLEEAITEAEACIETADEKVQKKAKNQLEHLKGQLKEWKGGEVKEEGQGGTEAQGEVEGSAEIPGDGVGPDNTFDEKVQEIKGDGEV